MVAVSTPDHGAVSVRTCLMISQDIGSKPYPKMDSRVEMKTLSSSVEFGCEAISVFRSQKVFAEVALQPSMRISGRFIPSAQIIHSPLITIDARHLFAWDVDNKTAVILGMRGLGQCPGRFRFICSKNRFPGDDHTLPAKALVDFRSPRLEPCPVAIKSLPLRLRPGEFRRGGHL